jgi:hypothetical protein
MYIAPVGANPPSDEDRQPIVRYVSGNELMINTRIALQGGSPATPGNSRVTVVLAETRFDETPIWTGTWNDGIVEVDENDHPGLVRITAPDAIAHELDRGSYQFAVHVSDRFGRSTWTPVRGTIIVEYEPGSPEHSIPYRE